MFARLEQKLKIIIVVQVISVLALIIFWLGYFLSPLFSWKAPLVYTDFPRALPLLDALLAFLMIAAGIAIVQGRRLGRQLTRVVAAFFLVLGIAGFHYPLQNGMILTSMVSMLKSGFVNLWCIVFGLYFLLKLRHHQGD